MSYSESFEKLWAARIPGWHPPSDSKKRAYYQYEKIKSVTTDQLIFCLRKQYQNREELKKNGEFAPKLPAMERWLRDERWGDALGEKEPVAGSNHPSHKPFEPKKAETLLSPEELRRRIQQLRQEHRL